MQLVEQQPLLITEDKYIPALLEILDDVTPKVSNEQPKLKETTPSLKSSLDNLFPEQQYDEKNIQKAKEILGPLSSNFTPEQLKDTVTEIQFLAESWLDDFEKEIFEGLTLKEMLHEKGGI